MSKRCGLAPTLAVKFKQERKASGRCEKRDVALIWKRVAFTLTQTPNPCRSVTLRRKTEGPLTIGTRQPGYSDGQMHTKKYCNSVEKLIAHESGAAPRAAEPAVSEPPRLALWLSRKPA